MNSNYTYAAILDYNEVGYINILFPEFDGLESCVEIGKDPIEDAQESLALALIDIESRGEDAPARKAENEIVLCENQKLVYINVWLPYYRSKVKEIYVKKTLTLPAWIDILAKQNGIYFSETLVNALKTALSLR